MKMRVDAIVCVAGLLAAAGSIKSQVMSPDKSVHPEREPSISMKLLAVPVNLTLGQSVRLVVTLLNTSDRMIFVGSEHGDGAPDYDVSISDDHGGTPPGTAYLRAIKGSRLPSDPRFRIGFTRSIDPVQPGQTVATTIDLTGLYTIDHPGVYDIHVERLDGISHKMVRSNTVSINVTQ